MGCRLWGRTESDTTEVDLAAAAAVELLIMDKYMSNSKRSRFSKLVVPLYTPTSRAGEFWLLHNLPLPPSEAQRGQKWPETWEKDWEENQEEVQEEEEESAEDRKEPRTRSQACRRERLGTGPALSLSGGRRCSVQILQSDSEQKASTAQP